MYHFFLSVKEQFQVLNSSNFRLAGLSVRNVYKGVPIRIYGYRLLHLWNRNYFRCWKKKMVKQFNMEFCKLQKKRSKACCAAICNSHCTAPFVAQFHMYTKEEKKFFFPLLLEIEKNFNRRKKDDEWHDNYKATHKIPKSFALSKARILNDSTNI